MGPNPIVISCFDFKSATEASNLLEVETKGTFFHLGEENVT